MRRCSLQPEEAILALGALAQEHRLALFKLLVRAGAEGLPAGAIAAELDIPNSSLSFHLAQLNRAGLVNQARNGRSLIYSANYAGMNALMGYLTENCCAGGASCGTEISCGPEASCAAPVTPQSERKSA